MTAVRVLGGLCGIRIVQFYFPLYMTTVNLRYSLLKIISKCECLIHPEACMRVIW